MGSRGAFMGGSSGSVGGDSSIGYDKTYESENGGTVYTEKSRIEQSQINKQEKAKYDKENDMCKHLADNGHTVIHLDDTKLTDGSYDILMDGKKADLKSLKGASNIHREGKSAINDQKAECVIFRFDSISPNVHKELNKLASDGIHGFYYQNGADGLYEF